MSPFTRMNYFSERKLDLRKRSTRSLKVAVSVGESENKVSDAFGTHAVVYESHQLLTWLS